MGKVRIVVQSWKHYWGELKHKRNEEGLTLIELMVVVVILGIIAAVAIPSISNAINSAKVNTTISDLSTYQQALQRYYLDHGSYPASFSTLDLKSDASGATGTGSTYIYGPYLNFTSNQAVNDAFGHPIYYDAVQVSGTDYGGYYLLSGGTTSDTAGSPSPTISKINASDIYASNGQEVNVLSQTPIVAGSSSNIAIPSGTGTFSIAQ